jgi:hypothetical protein
MANLFNSRDVSIITPVALTPVNDSYYEDFTLEPAMVRVRAPNSAYLVLSTVDVVNKAVAPIACTIASPGDGILMRKAKRIGIKFVQFNNTTTTINRSNNTLLMFRSSNQTIYTLTIPSGPWNTPQLLITALNTANVNAATGVTFTFFFVGSAATNQAIPLVNNVVTMSASEPIVFLSSSSAIMYGNSTFGWPVINTPQWNGLNPYAAPTDPTQDLNNFTWTSMVIGPMPCRYTRYVDFFSSSLTSWTKLPSANSRAGANSFIYRLFLDQFNDYSTNPGAIVVGPSPTAIIWQPIQTSFESSATNPITWTLNVGENITTVQFDVRDEYGKEFSTFDSYVVRESTPGNNTTINREYSPNVFTGGVSWSMAFYAEL